MSGQQEMNLLVARATKVSNMADKHKIEDNAPRDHLGRK